MDRTFGLLIGVLFLSVLSPAQDNGRISGTVADDTGTPVRNATVYAHPMDRPLYGVIPHAISDDTGAYIISKLEYGRYSVSAAKPEDDYPELYLTFYVGLHAKLQIARLSPEHLSARINLRLGKKAGVLVGTVTDAITGEPLNANVEFRRVNEAKNFLSGSGLTNAKFRILVPSDVPITMQVSLDGYENWKYTSASEEARLRGSWCTRASNLPYVSNCNQNCKSADDDLF
jgi:carboxypeptidase family protein